MSEKFLQYDEICMAALYCVNDYTQGADRLVLTNLDLSDKDHLFILATAMNWHGVTGKDIAVDCGFITRMRLAMKYPKMKFYSPTKEDLIKVDVEEVLSVLRPGCVKLCGDSFTFGDIYDAFFSGKEITNDI